VITLIREASVAFPKLLLSVLGFLRFIPSSRFYASETEAVIDLSGLSRAGEVVVWELQFAATGDRPAFLRDEPFVIFPKG